MCRLKDLESRIRCNHAGTGYLGTAWYPIWYPFAPKGCVVMKRRSALRTTPPRELPRRGSQASAQAHTALVSMCQCRLYDGSIPCLLSELRIDFRISSSWDFRKRDGTRLGRQSRPMQVGPSGGPHHATRSCG